jgi:hypothetical protein
MCRILRSMEACARDIKSIIPQNCSAGKLGAGNVSGILHSEHERSGLLEIGVKQNVSYPSYSRSYCCILRRLEFESLEREADQVV